MKDESWEDFRLFFLVATEGGLTPAAQKCGLSPATLGRRMQALERTLGRTLFLRRQTGYELAPDGRVLLDRVKGMQMAAQSVLEWKGGPYEMPIVSISADHWMARFLATNLSDLWTPCDGFRLCFKSGSIPVDLAHRETQIGIRTARPHQANLAGRRLVDVAFAPYCARSFDLKTNPNWVALGSDVSIVPSERWVLAQPELWITVWANAPGLVYDLIRSGAGRGVLPCFVGDDDPGLVRAGAIIEDLGHTSWIVMHDEERHRPEVRTVIDRLVALCTNRRELFGGRGDQEV
ncbi:LysR family transcriptional regulator [Consotaella aegiceratis]|uniref:LysR family transcriptional regulator n=1 Tax=Consotaella aegiceratis TaxID=3097961 RepID=UPI002F40BEF6